MTSLVKVLICLCVTKTQFAIVISWPVTGASMSSRFFSARKIAPPSPMSLRATASSTRPSLVRWAFSTSTLGFPSLSNTSLAVSRWLGGNGTAAKNEIKEWLMLILSYLQCFTVLFIDKSIMRTRTHITFKLFDYEVLCTFQGIDSQQERELVFTSTLTALPLRQFTRLLLWSVTHSIFNIYNRTTQFIVCMTILRAKKKEKKWSRAQISIVLLT